MRISVKNREFSLKSRISESEDSEHFRILANFCEFRGNWRGDRLFEDRKTFKKAISVLIFWCFSAKMVTVSLLWILEGRALKWCCKGNGSLKSGLLKDHSLKS